MPLNIIKPKGFNNESYFKYCELGGYEVIKTQLKILRNRRSKFYQKSRERQKVNYEIAYLEYLKYWHEAMPTDKMLMLDELGR